MRLIHKNIKEKECKMCGVIYFPTNRKQKFCGSPLEKESCSYKNHLILKEKCRIKNRDNGKTRLWNRKYRNQRKCSCCGEKEIKFLAFDHVMNDGKQHRKIVKQGLLVGWLIKNNYPKNIQVLCHNCNLAKGFYGKCPHTV